MDQGDTRAIIPRPARRDQLDLDAPGQPEAIRRQIEASRRQIAESLDDLRLEVTSRVDHALDWRGWVGNHPHHAIGIAFSIGLYLGLR